MMFLAIGAVSATESINALNTEDSNIMCDDVNSLSANKLEISNEVSISETNIVNSHDDNLGSYSDNEVLNASSDCENNNQEQSTSDVDAVGENTLSSTSSSTDSVVTASSSNNIVSADSSAKSSVIAADKLSTKLSVSNTHFAKSSTYFDVTLKDKDGTALANQKVILKVNKKSYSGFTNENGIASIKTDGLNIGAYEVSLTYGGNSNYSSSSLSKKVRVMSSAIGSDLTKNVGYSSDYKVTFWKNNNLLSKTKVTFKVNGKTYTRTTDSKGVATIKINLGVGKYTITAINPYSKEKVSHKIVVNKDGTKLTSKSKTYIQLNKKGSFKVVLKSNHNVLLKNKKISFTYNGKTVTSRTNENGEAKITIPVLAKGTYKISFKYKGNSNYYSAVGTAKLIVAKPTTKFSASSLVMKYNDGSKFKVKLTKANGDALANKNVKIKFNGKTAIYKTNQWGNVKLSLKNVKPGNYVVKYYHSSEGSKDYSHGSSRIIILKMVAKVSASDLTMKSQEHAVYKVKVKDSSGKLLKGVYVKTDIGKQSYIYATDSNGIAKLNITKETGDYKAKTIVADPLYKSAPVTKHILVKGTKFVASNLYSSGGKSITYSVKLVNEKNKPVSGKNIVFSFEGKSLNAKTNSKGVAKINLGTLSKGTHKINFNQDNTKGSAKIYVANKVSVKNILAASKSVKNYISKYSKLPSSVKIGDVSFNTADYLYLASKAIVNLKKGNTKDIAIKFLKNPSNPQSSGDLGYLKDYLGVAKSVVKTAESNGKIPDSVNSKVGSIGYDGSVYVVSMVLSHYGKHKKFPAYVQVKSVSGKSSSMTGVLNSKNKISNLLEYLAASRNCEVNNPKIKNLVSKLTKGCKNDKEKADKIFNYVRDTISYSFYYNTKFGAAGTVTAKTGNCVDHAHVIVAMYRAAGLPARYVHGTCHFSSGHTYGHVWAQVLLGDTWTVADAISTRNSLGHVANWNTNSYKLEGYYQSLPF